MITSPLILVGSFNTSRSRFVSEDCGIWSTETQPPAGQTLLNNSLIERPHRPICHLSFPLFTFSTLSDYFHLAALPPLSCLCLCLTSFACDCILSCSSHGTPSTTLSPVSPSLPSFLPTSLSLFPLIISHATLALQGSSHWSLLQFWFVMPLPFPRARLIGHCPLSFLLRSLSLALLPSFASACCLISYFRCQRFVFSPQHATEVFFICDAFISTERLCGIGRLRVRPAA